MERRNGHAHATVEASKPNTENMIAPTFVYVRLRRQRVKVDVPISQDYMKAIAKASGRKP